MGVYAADEWGNQFADDYDQLAIHLLRDDAPLCVAALADLASGMSALELGVGTGRIALPLASRGCQVSAIDGSTKMLDKLRAKPGADRLSLICGDLADVPAEGRFDLIYIVYNTLTCLVTQSDQLRCFQNVGQKLTEHGAFVVETFVPWKTLLEGRINEVGAVTEDSVNFILGRVDPVQQVMDTQLVVIDKRGTKLFPVRYRYVWPSELDLMAHNAGLKLEERWGTWDRHPFTAESKSQIAIYRPK